MIEAFTSDQRKAYFELSKAIDAYNQAPVSELADTRRVKDVLPEVMSAFPDELLAFCDRIISELKNENDDIYSKRVNSPTPNSLSVTSISTSTTST
jgi:hypothetical protein